MWIATGTITYMMGKFLKEEVKHYFPGSIDKDFDVHCE
jgi:hypothetical protein